MRDATRRSIAALLVLPALLIAIGAARAQAPSPQPGTNVNQNNSSDGSDAGSGGASASNSASGSAGPQSNGGGDAQSIEGSNSGAVVQDGNNESSTTQQGTARSGDAVAGSQVTGVVGGGDVTINATNVSEDSEAESGDVSVTNNANVVTGPNVFGGNCPSAPEGPNGASIDGEVGGCVIQDGNNTADITQSANSETGDAVAGGQILGVVANAGTTEINASNDSEDASATSGDSRDVGNSIRANVGPEVATEEGLGNAVDGGDVGVAALEAPLAVNARPLSGALSAPGAASIRGSINGGVVQDGRNELDAEQLAESATGDAVAGGQIFGVVASGGTTSITADNTSEDAQAESGESDASNDAEGDVGPRFEEEDFDDGLASIDVDELTGDIVQDGRNSGELQQGAVSASGDAVAGGAIYGVVNTGGDVVIDASNTSEDDEATSGASGAFNDGELTVGNDAFVDPFGGGASIEGGTAIAPIIQDGNNEAAIEQLANGSSGDAVAGGQILGLVGAGDASISLDNTSEDSSAESGQSDVANGGTAFAGNVFEGPALGAGGASIEADVLNSGIVHEGDNESSLAQDASGATGDAVAGGQVVGAVTSAGGSIAVDATNSSEDAQATSGESDVAQGAEALTGNGVEAEDLANAAAIEIGVGSAGIVQEGDNAAEVEQVASAPTGDAVAGGQVVGLVSAGDTSVVLDNTSEDDEAESGAAAIDQDALGISANQTFLFDAGGQSIEAGILGAAIVQEGENETSVAQEAAAATGDAVAGGQVVGSVTAAGGSTSIDATNASEDGSATSGDADVSGLSLGGAANLFFGDTGFGASIEGGILGVGILQEGDNEVDALQSASAASGDAVAGGQIIGTVGGGDTSIVLDNTSEDDEATSGRVTADQASQAISANFAGADLDGSVGLSSIEVALGFGEIVHEGDNETALEQTAAAASGDAVAGGQVVGAVNAAGGSISIDATNASEDGQATSGDSGVVQGGTATAANASGQPFFASIELGLGFAGIVQEGDNAAELAQNASTASGDAVAGGQIFGVVGSGGNVDIVADNTSEDAESESGAATGENLGEVVAANLVNSGLLLDAPEADAIEVGVGFAGVVHDGDNEAALEQSVGSASGDAVAGGQIAGAVAGDGSDIALDLTNSSEDDSATTGEAAALNGGAIVAIDSATSFVETQSIEAEFLFGGVVHDGDNELAAAQSATAATGDAVGGGQVMGVVGSGGDASIVASSTSEDSEAESGSSDADNRVIAVAGNLTDSGVGPDSIEGGTISAGIVHDGGNEIDLAQAVDSASGDAVAGGQVAGVVAAPGGDIDIDIANTSEDAQAISGDSEASSDALAVSANLDDAFVQLASIDGDAIDADIVHDGSNRLTVDQSLSVGSGDALGGAQVVGVVSGGDVDITQDSTSSDDSSVSGDTSGSSSSTDLTGSVVGGFIDLGAASLMRFAGLFGGGVLTVA